MLTVSHYEIAAIRSHSIHVIGNIAVEIIDMVQSTFFLK